MATLGQTIFIAAGTSTSPIAATRTDEIQVDGEVVEISDPNQGEWKRFISGRKEWSVTVGWLVTTNTDVQRLLAVNTAYTLTFRNDTTVYLTGSAFLKSCKINATHGSLMTGSFTFKGNGPLSSV